MIITEINGGLGNQMFQYAAGRALSLRRGVPLALDTSRFTVNSPHQGFELYRVFNCNTPQVDKASLKGLWGWLFHPFVRKVLRRQVGRFLRPKSMMIQPHFHYFQGFNELPSNCHLSGFWQSARYFEDFSEQIRNDFTFRSSPNSKNQELAQRIATVNSVSLHIRRGDYIDDPGYAAMFYACPIDYYNEAIKFIADRIYDPHFFIFSNDIDWAKSNLKINFNAEYVSHNTGADSYNDMRLMSLCKHNIIANSTFIWWGAWLNRFSDKIVIMPKRWFWVDVNETDLPLSGWVRM